MAEGKKSDMYSFLPIFLNASIALSVGLIFFPFHVEKKCFVGVALGTALHERGRPGYIIGFFSGEPLHNLQLVTIIIEKHNIVSSPAPPPPPHSTPHWAGPCLQVFLPLLE